MSTVAPLREAIDLEPRLESAGAGRRFLRVTLTSWACPEEAVEQAIQVGAELVSNAILHAGTPLRLDVSYVEPLVRVSVRDYSPATAAVRIHRPDAMTGRGLDLVAGLSQAWGVEPGPDGKVVWAEVDGRSHHGGPLRDGANRAMDPARSIRFVSLPVPDFLAMTAHHDAMLREVELAWLDGTAESGETTPEAPELLRLARTLAEPRDLLRRAVEAAAAEGRVRADVVLELNNAQLRALRDWSMAMQDAEELSRSGQVLAPPAGDEIVTLRRSLVKFVEDELAGTGEAGRPIGEIEAVEALRLTFQHAPIGMAMVSLEGRFLYVNRALCDIVGRDEQELRGMTFQAITHPSDLPANLDMFDEARTGGRRTYEIEKRYVHADGHEVPVLLSVALARDQLGRARHFISQIQDLSARKEAEAALAASEERLRQVSDLQLGLALEATGMGAWDVDLSTADIRWTNSLDELLGYSHQSLNHATPLLDVVHPDDRAAVQTAVSAARQTGEPQEQDFRVLGRDGSVRWMLAKIRVRRGADGTATHLVGVVLDVTDRRRVEESLRIERTAAQSAARRLARLQAATARLSEVRALDDVAETILAEVTQSLAADQAGLWLLGRDAKTMRLVGSHHYPDAVAARLRQFTLEDYLPATEALRTGRPFETQPTPETGLDAALSYTLPLQIEGRPTGLLSLSWKVTPPLDDEERRFILALGDQCAQALDRARLYEAERRAVRRQEFLAEASRELAASLDFTATVERLARLLVPELADACSVMVVEADGVKAVAHAHIDPAREKLLRQISERPDATAITYLTEVVRTGEAVLNPAIDPALVDATALDDEHREQLRVLDIRSGMAVPMRARGNTVGLIALQMTDTGRQFRTEDVEAVLDLADRAAVAIDNARTYELRSQVAETLQRSLLPGHLPTIPGAQLAARYDPAQAGVEVGGDFYDVFDSDGDWALALGDVRGKGATAAALTAMVRYSLRALAIGLYQPSAILARLNEAILRQRQDDEQFCTVVYTRLVQTAHGIRATVCSGGHPLPLVVRADGTVTRLGTPGGLLGLFAEIPLAEETTELGPGDALVQYTDGVTEAHRGRQLFGEERLAAVLAGQAGSDAETIADAVQQAVLDFTEGPRRDDVAVLVLRIHDSRN